MRHLSFCQERIDSLSELKSRFILACFTDFLATSRSDELAPSRSGLTTYTTAEDLIRRVYQVELITLHVSGSSMG